MLLALLVWSTLVRRCPKKYRERTEPDALPHTRHQGRLDGHDRGSCIVAAYLRGWGVV